ncbi:MAG: class I SAM-dependent methyltransferase [Candidatus Omnitrophota bacterium]
MKYSIEFVLKVNEIYHDIEESEYEEKHPEIFQNEPSRWQKIGTAFIANNPEKICLLDIGSGTGFVPIQIGNFLKKGDLFVCSDISANILNACKANISDEKFKCHFKYLKLDGKKIDLESNTFDYITLNSVLHHIPDLPIFFKEINKLLKTNGRLIIGHEPNKLFYTHKFLWNNYRLVSYIFDRKQFTAAILRKLKLHKIAGRIYKGFNQEVKPRDRVVEDANKRLLREGIIKTPLTADQMCEIVDIHSPTAGGYHKDRGIDIAEILRDYLPGFEIEYLETYNHLCKISSKNRFTKWYNSVLGKIFHGTGSTFLMVLKKGTPLRDEAGEVF